MPIIEAAFRDAQAASLTAYKRAAAEGVRRDERDRVEARALIEAYLSHPEVQDAAFAAYLQPVGQRAEQDVAALLQAIGAKP